MARRYLNLGHEEWRGLPWPVQRAYLEGMEADESVPLAAAPQEVPDGMPWQQRRPEGAAAPVIDITAMIGDLEASRGEGR